MKNALFSLWGVLFIICAALGFIPDPQGGARIALTIIGFSFFLPPAALLVLAKKEKDTRTPRLIGWLSGLSLLVSLIALVLNILFATGSTFVGDFLYSVLIVVSTPMICTGYIAYSLFCWACLLFASLRK